MILKSPGMSKTRLHSRRRRAALALSTSHYELDKDVRDLKETPGSIVEKFALQILHERLRVQHIGELKRM
jgi:hypothetical protein